MSLESLQRFGVFGKQVCQVSDRQHGGLRVLHGSAAVAANKVKKPLNVKTL